jgi:Flp pilus assembly protein TadG
MALLRTKRRGAAAIETALVLPLVLLVTFGVIEYGWLLLKSQQISNACRHGARIGARYGSSAATITAAVQSSLNTAGLGTSGFTLTLTPSDPMTLASGDALTVHLLIPYANVGALGLPLIPVPTNLQSTVVIAREGP